MVVCMVGICGEKHYKFNDNGPEESKKTLS